MLFKLALTKVTTLDDATPTGTPSTIFDVPDHHDRPGDMPTASLAVFVEFLDVASAEVMGASCSMRLWLQDQRSSKWFSVDARKTSVAGRSGIAFSFPPLNFAAKGYIQVTDVAGSGITQIKVYVAETGAIAPGYDPVTGALRVADVLVHGGEQNAIGAHMTAVRVTQSPDGAAAFDDPAALEASSVTKAGPGCLYGFIATNTNATVRYLQFYDLTAVPADTAVPKLVFALQPGVTMAIQIPPERRYFATGICWAVSTTIATKTVAAAETWCNVAYG